MKTIRRAWIAAAFSAVALMGDYRAVAGNWEGKLHGQTGVTLAFRENGGTLQGTVVFYVFRDKGNGPVVVGKEHHEVLVPKLDQGTLRFQVKSLSGEMVSLVMRIRGPNEGELQVTDPQGHVMTTHLIRAK